MLSTPVEFDSERTDKLYTMYTANQPIEVSDLTKFLQVAERFNEYAYSTPHFGIFDNDPKHKSDAKEFEFAKKCLDKLFVVTTLFGQIDFSYIRSFDKIRVGYSIHWRQCRVVNGKNKSMYWIPKKFCAFYHIHKSDGRMFNVEYKIDAVYVKQQCSGQPKALTIDKRDIEIENVQVNGIWQE